MAKTKQVRTDRRATINKAHADRLAALEAVVAWAQKSLLFAALAMDDRPTMSQIAELHDAATSYRKLARKLYRITHARSSKVRRG